MGKPDTSDADTRKLSEDMASLFNETNCDMGRACIIALHFAVAAGAGYFDNKRVARVAMVETLDEFLGGLPDDFADLDNMVN